jgi:hypothetical protein
MVMNENRLLLEISNIVRLADGIPSALARIHTLPAVCEFLESRPFPFRGRSMSPLNSVTRAAGTPVACIGKWGVPGDMEFAELGPVNRQRTGAEAA